MEKTDNHIQTYRRSLPPQRADKPQQGKFKDQQDKNKVCDFCWYHKENVPPKERNAMDVNQNIAHALVCPARKVRSAKQGPSNTSSEEESDVDDVTGRVELVEHIS